MKYLISELTKILNAKSANIIEDLVITGIAIDSRKVKQGDLFIPFVGENVDGHNYIQTAFDNGASASLSMLDNLSVNNNIIVVDDSYKAIQTLAKHYLEQLNPKTISITGSNGKTTTKDIVSDVLRTKFKVHKTAGNFNNELGLPITILAAPEDTEVMVLEMGADGFNQLNLLSKIANPDFAIITNIGESHIEFFKNRAGIARGKFEIIEGLKENGSFIYNGDEPLLRELVNNVNINNISCGEENFNNIILENYEVTPQNVIFKLNTFNNNIKSKLKGKHNILNMMYALAIARELDFTEQEIIAALESITEITKMRLENVPYGENSLIINDAYNASPTSMKAAVTVLDELVGYKYKTLVLGSMFELGNGENEFHASVGTFITEQSSTINKVISVGDLAKNITDCVKNNDIELLHYATTDEVAKYLKANKQENEVILFKASRGMKLETIINEILQ